MAASSRATTIPTRPTVLSVPVTASGSSPQGRTSSNGGSRARCEVSPPTKVSAMKIGASRATGRQRLDGRWPSGTTKAMATIAANSSGQPCVSKTAAARAPGRSRPVP